MTFYSFWYNFRTCEYDALLETPADLVDYIPQNWPAKLLYELYINKLGKTPLEAALKVLKACVNPQQS